MNSPIVEIDAADWRLAGRPEWTAAVEDGKLIDRRQVLPELLII